MKNSYIYFTAKIVRNYIIFTHTHFLTKALIFKAFQLMGGLEPLTSTLPMWCRFLGKSVTW